MPFIRFKVVPMIDYPGGNDQDFINWARQTFKADDTKYAVYDRIYRQHRFINSEYSRALAICSAANGYPTGHPYWDDWGKWLRTRIGKP